MFGKQEEPRQPTWISNRKNANDEEQERQQHPPIDAGAPPPSSVGGETGETLLTAVPDRHTSHKAGSRSIAQKEDASKYADRSMPATHKVAGAFGEEPGD